MRVVIDGGSWSNQRGFGRFTREVVRALGLHGRYEYVMVLDQTTTEPPKGVSIAYARLETPASRAAAADGWRSPSDLLRMSRAISQQRADVIFFPCVYTYVPVWTTCAVVTGIHDTIAERFPSLVFPSPRARWFWRAKMRAALWQSDRVVTVSEHARRAVAARLGVPSLRLRVVNEAAGPVFRPISDPVAVRSAYTACDLDPDAPTLFYVGGLAPHKNLERVISAFATVTDDPRHARARFVLVGHHASDVFHSAEQSLRALVAARCPGRVQFVAGVDDEQLVHLLNGAQGLILASLDEGFGLPGIEAAACGCAVVATSESAMPEILGDAALYVDPQREPSIVAALATVLSEADPRQRWGRTAMQRANAVGWQQCAQALDLVFAECARSGVSR